MATGPRYFVLFRRRKEGKTDYYKRAKLVVSDRPRMVVRKTNRQIIIQMVLAEMDGDRTLVSASSTELANYGYNGSTSALPAAYLTGMLFAVKALNADKQRAKDMGVDDYLVKSQVVIADVVNRVKQHLGLLPTA